MKEFSDFRLNFDAFHVVNGTPLFLWCNVVELSRVKRSENRKQNKKMIAREINSPQNDVS